MGNSIPVSVNLDHEVANQQEGKKKLTRQSMGNFFDASLCFPSCLSTFANLSSGYLRDGYGIGLCSTKSATTSTIAAIEAGKTLMGKVIVDVKETLDPTGLTIEVNGKERTIASNDEGDIEGEARVDGENDL